MILRFCINSLIEKYLVILRFPKYDIGFNKIVILLVFLLDEI
ncbi:hypothetical protein LEP1GSC024_2757 [Leptospira noguchii str. 2001034031]|uniref:Uncharacterized protein n=1 Tax=Leptospira noguchii str. 2001034031 TaxID=1193053 RepID=M6YNI9_9LEPT|nr:hypothetical protein LEP1GSC024_2757 [Leptospira noguchii str. 2001034031]